jgi:hypothetical protein
VTMDRAQAWCCPGGGDAEGEDRANDGGNYAVHKRAISAIIAPSQKSIPQLRQRRPCSFSLNHTLAPSSPTPGSRLARAVSQHASPPDQQATNTSANAPVTASAPSPSSRPLSLPASSRRTAWSRVVLAVSSQPPTWGCDCKAAVRVTASATIALCPTRSPSPQRSPPRGLSRSRWRARSMT